MDSEGNLQASGGGHGPILQGRLGVQERAEQLDHPGEDEPADEAAVEELQVGGVVVKL